MGEGQHHRRVVRFGVFEMDLDARELCKSGVRVRLQDQPFRVLTLLVEHPGKIVSREEIKDAVWAEDTFVEFDHGLNTVVQKIRQALGDSATSPRFLETVPRRGYRFLAPVEGLRVARDPAGRESPTAEVPGAVDSEAKHPRQNGTTPTAIQLGAAAILLIAAAVGVTWLLTRPPSSPSQPTIEQLTFDVGLSIHPAISPDGTLVAYASDRAAEGNLDIWLKPVAGGQPTRLTSHEAVDDWPAFSPDGGRIAFYSQRDGGAVYVVPLLGGEATLIASNARRPRFSPDGKWIAYSFFGSGGRLPSVQVVPASGGESRQLRPSNFSDWMWYPVWAPDSKHLLFADGSHEWWFASIEGGVAVNTGASKVFDRHRLTGIGASRVPVPGAWLRGKDRVVFSAAYGDSTNLWTISISPDTGRVASDPQRLTTGRGADLDASAAAGGRLAYSGRSETTDIWSLPLDPDRGEVRGELEALTRDTAGDYRPGLSADGRKMVFTSERSGNIDVWIRDIDSAKDTALTVSPSDEIRQTIITSDGATVAYQVLEDQKRATYVVSATGGAPRKVCDECGQLDDWSSDENRILHQEGAGVVALLDLKSGTRRTLIQHPEHLTYSARFSPDDRWVALHARIAQNRRQIVVAPFRDGAAISPEDWILVTDGSMNEHDPSWSPNGRLLYYASEAAGSAGIQAQRLEPATKRPVGAPIDIYRVSEPGRSIAGPSAFQLSVAGDRMVLNLTEARGNIWMMEPSDEE